MAQFRDLQKLRDKNTPSRQTAAQGRTSRLDRFKPDFQSFGLNLNKVLKPQPPQQPPSAATTSTSKPKTHRKGLSINGFTFYQQRRDQMTPSPILSIYNYSTRLPKNDAPTNFIPMTSRDDYQKYREFDRHDKQIQTVTKSWFKVGYVIGKGGFGKVWKVELKKNGRVFAMKEMYKTKIIEKKSVNSVMNQRALLARFKHPFLVNMSYAFQDRQNLYLVMDYLNGGDLRYHIGKRRRFTQPQTKFFICCMLLSLQYLHSKHVIHRDLKPQNLVLDSSGYLRLTDLGISRQHRDQNFNDTSGTPGYMAPEVMFRKNHSYTVDYFAVGVMGYEFMMGRRPYTGRNRKEIREQILARQAEVRQDEIPKNWSAEAVDFINRLLVRNPRERLGVGGAEEVRRHDWLRNVDWGRLGRKELRAPYIPTVSYMIMQSLEENYDQYKKQISEDTVIENPEENALLLRDRQIQELFDGYFFDIDRNKTGSTSNTQITETEAINYKGFMDYRR